MSKPTYEELQAEVQRLRAKLSFNEDKEFTSTVQHALRELAPIGLSNGKCIARPKEIWEAMHPQGESPSTRDLAKLGRSLQALGWARSAKSGNLVFTLPVNEWPK